MEQEERIVMSVSTILYSVSRNLKTVKKMSKETTIVLACMGMESFNIVQT